MPGWQHAFMILTGTVVGVVVVTCLYWAQTVFIPVVLAVLLTFLLAPLVTALQRCGLRRLLSVIVVVMLAGALLGGVVWLVTAQVTSLAGEAPKYTENIKGKVKSLRRLGQGSVTSRLEKMIARHYRGVEPAHGVPRRERHGGKPVVAARREPTTVVVEPERPVWLARTPALLDFPARDARQPGLGPGAGRFHAAEVARTCGIA